MRDPHPAYQGRPPLIQRKQQAVAGHEEAAAQLDLHAQHAALHSRRSAPSRLSAPSRHSAPSGQAVPGGPSRKLAGAARLARGEQEWLQARPEREAEGSFFFPMKVVGRGGLQQHQAITRLPSTEGEESAARREDHKNLFHLFNFFSLFFFFRDYSPALDQPPRTWTLSPQPPKSQKTPRASGRA